MFDQATMRIIPSASVVRAHLFRHGAVEGSRVCRGWSDVALSAHGRDQTTQAAAWLRANVPPPDLVIGSDLSRCAALAREIDAQAILDPALREQDMGRWEGRAWADLTREDPAGVTAYWDDYVSARPPGGETYGECYARVVRWWDDQRFTDQRVVVVTHIGVIRALLCHWLGLGPAQALRWSPAYASHTQVLLADAGVVVERFGETVTG